MSMVKFSSYVFTVLMMTINNENEKKMVEASASVCLPRPWCETNYQESWEISHSPPFQIYPQKQNFKGKINISTEWDETDVSLYNFLARHAWVLEIIFQTIKRLLSNM